jgi:signal transduction histidine kinase
MLRKSFSDAVRHPTSYVFLFVVIAGLVMAAARARPPLTPTELAFVLALSTVYCFVGTVIFLMVLTSTSPAARVLYLAFQIGLGTLILYLSRGNGWLLMLPLASHSVALFSPSEAVIPCILVALAIAWNTSRWMPDWIPFLQSALVFGSAVFFAAVFTNISIRDTRRREQIERLAAELEAANQALHTYAARVEELAALQERNRLAREIHDGLGHYLTAINVQAKVVETLIEQDAAEARRALSRMQAMILEALADVRRSVAALRSDPALEKSLPEAIQPLLEECRAAGLVTEFSQTGEASRLPAVIELTLYRAVQEGLTNTRKHAQAQRVIVEISYLETGIVLHIQDDGAGSEASPEFPRPEKGSFGLFGLRERVLLLGGQMHVRTAPGQGFTLEIDIPYEKP